MSANDTLADRSIAHAVAILRYGAGLSDRVVRLLNSVDADVVDKLAARLARIESRGFDLGPQTTTRLNQLLDELRGINAAIYGEVLKELSSELTGFTRAEAGYHGAALESAIAIEVKAALPSPTRLKAIVTETPIDGVLLKPWIEGMEQARMDRISQAIRLGLVQGESTDRIVARVRGTRAKAYTDGVLNISRRSAQTMVRTAVTAVSNATAQETWKANGNVVKGWRFTATLDSRTTSICASKDGKVWPVGEGPVPPLHPACRSISVAVTKSYREMGIDRDELTEGQRASMDGQVSASTRYPDWLKSKSMAVQEDILGKQRAKWFNQGKLTYSQLIDPAGRFLTLDDLQSKYRDILG